MPSEILENISLYCVISLAYSRHAPLMGSTTFRAFLSPPSEEKSPGNECLWVPCSLSTRFLQYARDHAESLQVKYSRDVNEILVPSPLEIIFIENSKQHFSTHTDCLFVF